MRTSIRTTSGSSSACELERLVAVRGFPYDLDVALRAEDHCEAFTDEGLVVGEQHPDHRGNGSCARTR
jgi:hypothetical protein